MAYKLIHGDCFEEMAKLESGSFDLILTDPPYGTMKGCSIDSWEKRGEKAAKGLGQLEAGQRSEKAL